MLSAVNVPLLLYYIWFSRGMVYRIVWHGFVPTLAFVFHFSFLLCKFRVRMSFALLHGFATSFSIILCHGSHLLALIVAHRSSFWCVFGPSIFISCLRNYVYYYIIIVIIIFLYCYYVHTPSTAIFGGRNTKHTYAYHRTNEKMRSHLSTAHTWTFAFTIEFCIIKTDTVNI